MQRASARLVATDSSDPPPVDELGARWRRRPVLAAGVRLLILAAPLAASITVGIVASRQFRPHQWGTAVLWALWVAAASLIALWAVDVVVRRLLPLHRLLQLCLAFPDRAPSRLRVAVRAARVHRPEAFVERSGAPAAVAEVAERIVTLLAALSVHDRRTRGHSERVCAYSRLLAIEMQLSEADCDRLTWAALVHDVGKLDVPARLLNKPGRPTVSEWQLLKTHPERGAALTEPLRSWLGPWTDAVLEHHERYDGAGYPRGLSGEHISLAARIIAVADAFEVMTAPRAYRRPVDAQTARAELARHAGSQFDPVVVRHFLAVGLPQLRRVMGPLSWLAQLPFVSSWPRLESAANSGAAHAATVTAAASTAGLLVFAGSGSVVAAQAASTPSSPVAAGDPVATAADHPAPTAPAAPGQVSRPGGSGSTASTAGAGTAPVRSRASRRAHSDRSGDARPDLSGRTAAAPRAGTQAATYPHDSSGSRSASCSDDEGTHGKHRARGHEHARGWQRNWAGDEPRHRKHGHDDGGCAD